MSAGVRIAKLLDVETHPTAALAALALLAAAVRVMFALRVGLPPAWAAVAAGAVTAVALGALARRWGGRAAVYTAGVVALTPGFVVTQTFYAADACACAAAALGMYFFDRSFRSANPAFDGAAAGICAATATSLLATAAVIPAFFMARSATAHFRRGPRRWWWLVTFVAAAGGAAVWEYARSGVWFYTCRQGLAPAFVHGDAADLMRRLFMGAAAAALWDGLGFSILAVAALAGSFFLIGRKTPGLTAYSLMFAISLLAFDVTPVTAHGYQPLALEPRYWMPAFLPASVVAGAALAQTRNSLDVKTPGAWTAAWSLSFVISAIFVSGTMPHAVFNFFLMAAATVTLLFIHGWTTRGRRFLLPAPAWAVALAAACFLSQTLTLFL